MADVKSVVGLLLSLDDPDDVGDVGLIDIARRQGSSDCLKAKPPLNQLPAPGTE